jgi:hypothetical protein
MVEVINALAEKNPQYFLKLSSNSHKYSSCESLFFPLNIGISHLMPSLDRNTVLLINNKPILWAMVVLMQVP